MDHHVHHLMIGTWTPPGAIFTVEFNSKDLKLKLIKRTEIPKDEPISWMAFSHDRRNIYGAGMKKWNSFSVESPTKIIHQSSRPLAGHSRANNADTKTRAIFVLPEQLPPYHVIGNPFYDFAGYGNVFAVDKAGALQQNVQNFEYQDNSAIHGMVFDQQEEYLYSADMWANKIWTHKKNHSTASISLVGSIDAPSPHDHPRWVELHPSGTYLYVLMESGNRLCEYAVDSTTHLPSWTGKSYPLVPPGMSDLFPKMYRSDVVFLSSSSKYLFATARSNTPSLTGYIAVFSLGATGQIDRQICLNPTPTSGGHSNAVSPCPWTDEWLALCDDEQGWIEVYRWHDEFLGRVAHLDIKEPGFGMNAIWYD
ncbi:hypothetical protein AMS68_006441 [Peltaster fructicola]|uniref:Carboxy-cis,cis-muconate cyclase n=1 Tax=Peltaster fructicola TaxID=286661 RepID=A0A6H0Y1P0_9PEZI|nr:hypothetical protein AMS68_006441 [Peltaster fructicola]